jgi:hypothetical protein
MVTPKTCQQHRIQVQRQVALLYTVANRGMSPITCISNTDYIFPSLPRRHVRLAATPKFINTMLTAQFLEKAALPPPHILLFELLLSSATIGLTPPSSLIRPAALPILGTCVYAIVHTSPQYMRARWAALLGGFSFTVLLQYTDVAVISKRNCSAPHDCNAHPSLLGRWRRGWTVLWSFRHLDTPSEAKHTPHFDANDKTYIPPRAGFVARQALAAAVCYLVLDLIAQRPPPANPQALFHPSLIPFFARLPSVTAPQVKLRFLSLAGFAVTFYCIIQGATACAASLAVGLGLSDVRSWRPAFGAVADAYSLKKL